MTEHGLALFGFTKGELDEFSAANIVEKLGTDADGKSFFKVFYLHNKRSQGILLNCATVKA